MSNTTYIQINGKNIDIVSGEITRRMDAIGEGEVTVLLRDVPEWTSFQGSTMKIYVGGQLRLTGYIHKRPEIQEIDPTEPLELEIPFLDELALLSNTLRDNRGYYEDAPVVDIINNLLLMTDDAWAADFATMEDLTVKTTIDLRGKTDLFAQVMEAVRRVPLVHVRYGGINGAGQYVLQVGNFNAVTTHLRQGANLLSLTSETKAEQAYSVIAATGDKAGDQLITLQDALNDARTTADPRYADNPISQHPVSGEYVVSRPGAATEAATARTYRSHKTDNATSPTVTQRAAAGYALWQSAVRDLDAMQPAPAFEAAVILPAPPTPGNAAYIASQVLEPIYDPLGNLIRFVPVFSVNDAYRMTEITERFDEAALIANPFEADLTQTGGVFTIEAVGNDELDVTDPALAVFAQLQRYDDLDSAAAVQLPITIENTRTHNGSDDADCNSDTGKLFTIASPTVPGGVSSVTVLAYTDDPDALIISETQPVSPGDNYTCCVQYNGNWTAGTPSIIVTALFQFR